MLRCLAIAALLALLLTACTSSRETTPQRSATEQLLISAAADRAAEQLVLEIPKGARIFVDATNFEGTDGKYAIAAIRDRLLRDGARLIAERGSSDVVVEIRSGALSIDDWQFLVGIPEFGIPLPFTGGFTFPEVPFFKKRVRQGVAKFAATGYDAKSGLLIASTGPRFGFSHETSWNLLFVSWEQNNIKPPASANGLGAAAAALFFTPARP